MQRDIVQEFVIKATYIGLYQTWFQDRPPETPGLTLVTEVVELVGPDRPLENCQRGYHMLEF